MVELIDQVAPQRIATEGADALGSLDRFRAGLARLKCAPRLVAGIDHLGGARRDPDQNVLAPGLITRMANAYPHHDPYKDKGRHKGGLSC
ncbi:hypothetical protein [Pseudoxanthomonas dokdonensis]|uniref:hypothetical protein n=1 Tax=Pseudoxanthomonas dokdonensis TaxID=344882 RepID=UPI001B80C12E|nr:hypothetical protein [Pseudoxanthomonas dokdonensis]